MKKTVFCIAILFFSVAGLFSAELKAREIALEAARQSSVSESVNYLKKQLNMLTVPAEKRSTQIFLADLQEQLSLYSDAQKNYAAAAGIAAADAEGMQKKTNEQLVLDAVRCALCAGEYATANSYLNSAVRNSKNPEIIAYVKLYEQWSTLCSADNVNDIQEPIEILKAYLNVNSMKSVQPAILLTLWYVTGDKIYSEQIINNFALSTEAAIVKGDVQLMPVPFWFFVPKSGIAEQGTGTFTDISVDKTTETQVVSTVDSSADSTGTETVAPKFSKWQLGLFKTEANAKALCDELIKKSFDAFVTSEKRASGTTYYIVLVNEDKFGTIADRLRSDGYDCYPVE